MMALMRSSIPLLLAAAVALALAGQAAATLNAVGRTPIMGWSGYNAFMQNSGHCDKAGAGGYNETTFVQTADVLVSSGLAKLGYVYLNLDDCVPPPPQRTTHAMCPPLPRCARLGEPHLVARAAVDCGEPDERRQADA